MNNKFLFSMVALIGSAMSSQGAIVAGGVGITGGNWHRPDSVIVSSTWNNVGPGDGSTGSTGVLANHLIQVPGTGVGDAEIDATLVDPILGTTTTGDGNYLDSYGALHEPDAGNENFGQWHDAGSGSNNPFSATNGVGYLMFDLGTAVTLQSLHIWNINQGGNLTRGVATFDVFLSNNVADFAAGQENAWGTAVLTGQNLAIGTNDLLAAEDFTLAGNTAQYVQIRYTSNHGNQFTGLSEVRVSEVIPEPSGTALFGLAGIVLLLRRRNR